MVDRTDPANILQGIGAGLQGRTIEFEQQMAAQAEIERRAKLEEDERRRRTMFTDSLRALQMVEAGDWAGAYALGQDRVKAASQIPGVDFSDTKVLTQMAGMAAEGNEEARTRLKKQLESNVELGYQTGALTRPPTAKDQVRQSQILADGTIITVDGQGNRKVVPPTDPEWAIIKKALDRERENWVQRTSEAAQARSDIKVDENWRLNDALAARERGIGLNKYEVKAIGDYVDSGLQAIPILKDFEDGLKILETTDTSGIAKYFDRIANKFGIESPATQNRGVLNNIFGKQIMDALQGFPGQISNQEREFAEAMSANLEAGTAVNEALLRRGIELLHDRIANAYDAAYAEKLRDPLRRLGRAMQQYNITPLEDMYSTQGGPSNNIFDEADAIISGGAPNG